MSAYKFGEMLETCFPLSGTREIFTASTVSSSVALLICSRLSSATPEAPPSSCWLKRNSLESDALALPRPVPPPNPNPYLNYPAPVAKYLHDDLFRDSSRG